MLIKTRVAKQCTTELKENRIERAGGGGFLLSHTELCWTNAFTGNLSSHSLVWDMSESCQNQIWEEMD